jgi:HTH-type transcriptional regulator/antitoxin HigA
LPVRIIALSTLKTFLNRSPASADAREPVMAWFRQVRGTDWATPAEVKRAIRSVSILRDGRVVFIIAGNKYRIIVWINYPHLSPHPVHGHAPSVRYDRCAERLKVEIMDVEPIKTQRDYRRVLKEIDGLMMAKHNTAEGDRLDVLVTLVEAWERKHYPLDLSDPVEAIKYHMEQNGLQPRDFIPFIGSRNRVHEVLNRRRPLTLKMIWRLHQGLGIPAESLIKLKQDRAA